MKTQRLLSSGHLHRTSLFTLNKTHLWILYSISAKSFLLDSTTYYTQHLLGQIKHTLYTHCWHSTLHFILCWAFNSSGCVIDTIRLKKRFSGFSDLYDFELFLAGDSNFIKTLVNFDKDNISDSVLKKVGQYCRQADFQPNIIGKVSLAAKSLCMWVRAMEVTYTWTQTHTHACTHKSALTHKCTL